MSPAPKANAAGIVDEQIARDDGVAPTIPKVNSVLCEVVVRTPEALDGVVSKSPALSAVGIHAAGVAVGIRTGVAHDLSPAGVSAASEMALAKSSEGPTLTMVPVAAARG